jgi:hypothetical protein
VVRGGHSPRWAIEPEKQRTISRRRQIAVASQSKAWACASSLAGIPGSKLAGDMDVVSVVCCQVEVSALG